MKSKQAIVTVDREVKQCELCAGTGIEKRMLSQFTCRRCGGNGRVEV